MRSINKINVEMGTSLIDWIKYLQFLDLIFYRNFKSFHECNLVTFRQRNCRIQFIFRIKKLKNTPPTISLDHQ
jgi:hypothetical protein